MKYKLNHIKRGAWYIYKRSDLETIHSLFLEFYTKALKPMCGDLRKFILTYNLKSHTVKIRQCMRLGEIKINLIREEEFAKEFYLLLDSIAATGIVSAPFYLVEIKFDPNIKANKSRRGSILTFKGGRGDVTGYYYLRGVLV